MRRYPNPATLSRTWRVARPQSLALLVALSGACHPTSPGVVLDVREIASPAGEGSGEPFLSSSGDTVYLSWLEARGEGLHELRFSRWTEGQWEEPRTVAQRSDFFVNWADFPSLVPGPGGVLWAHWLQRGPGGGYDYGIRIVSSLDGGRTWSEPWTPHEDGTPTEHGFVSAVPVGDRLGFLWLDGRELAANPPGAPPSGAMALYFRAAAAGGAHGPETLVDPRVCDCCQTDVALAARGPVAVYRDRSPEEIRDVSVSRLEAGRWTAGVRVHEDGWETGACPVNGPAVAARGERVAVAWFTAAGGVPRVKVSFSHDSGRSFREPFVVDDGNPAGRTDLLVLDDGGALVSWLERTGGEAADVRVRYVAADGGMDESVSVSASSAARASGFPRLARTEDGTVLAAWTDATSVRTRVRVARIDVARAP